jgi:hypothetical protein
MNDMTEYSTNIIKCIDEWSCAASKCDGDSDCLEECAQQLRRSLDDIFPPSKSIDLESDKINYLLSSIFFLANRLTKSTIGLSELDKAMGDVKLGNVDFDKNTEAYNKFQNRLDRILREYF